MIIRAAAESDLEGLLLLEKQWCSGGWSDKQLKDELVQSGSIALVTEIDREIVASLFLRCCFPEAELMKISVSEQVRGTKLGTGLLAEGLELLSIQQIKTCFLEVRQSNLRARNFYQSLGFEQCGRRPQYYTDPVEDAVLMQVDIPARLRRRF